MTARPAPMVTFEMLKFAAVLILLLNFSAEASSWSYNDNGGFGIEQPDGWEVSIQGRSSELTGPVQDFAQTKIFLGSDWVTGIRSISDLEKYVKKQAGSNSVRKVQNSGLEGFQFGTSIKGRFFYLRQAQNLIVVTYQLRGSSDQIQEGQIALDSIEIRTQGNPDPCPQGGCFNPRFLILNLIR